MTVVEIDEVRATRAENYAVKRASGFSCEACGADDRLLVVDVKAEDRLGVVCEGRCLDRRRHDVRPHQWDEAEKLRARLRRSR